MSEGLSRRAQALFDQAVELPPGERAAFLNAACPDDPALRAEVEALLASDADFSEVADHEGVLKSPLVRASEPTLSAADKSPEVPSPGTPVRVGRYRILRRIAEGGMGTVYEAEQDNPHRVVALKVIRSGLASPTHLSRFTHEAQILGRLNHPGIAQVYEADLADDGQPFFAMEFIRGLPLDRYAGQRQLDLPSRLSLLARVCDAVQHAHDEGVIHRDLKPSNILVDESGQPKVLDFGVARVIDADLRIGTDLTRTGQLVGTLSYMSPEQVAADPAALDRRSDVYTLGVILFELLAGRLPYPLDNLPLVEVARMIQEWEPPRLGSIDTRFRGDVETILARALEKDPARRYQSAADLAVDLRRWLNHEPILARPPSALYHLRKFARRHKGLVGGVLATGLALILGLVGTILFAVGEARQRTEAERNARAANEEKRETRFQAYRARIAAAVAALAAQDVGDAARHLEAAPEDLRDWEWRHLSSRLDDSSASIALPAEFNSVLLAAPDGFQATSMTPGGLHVTDLESGESKTLPIRPDHGVFVNAALTRRGLRAAVWLGPEAFSGFNLLDEAGQVVCRVETPGAAGRLGVAVSVDGTRVACFRHDGNRDRLVVFDATSGKQIAVCEGHKSAIWSFKFTPDGRRIASGSEDQTACIWDAATGEKLATCKGHTSKILSVAFSPDGTRLVTTSSDGTVRQWATAAGREVEPPYDHHTGEVTAAVYSPDGHWVASAGTDRTIRVWRATGRQEVAVLHGHAGAVSGLTFARSGRRLASFSPVATTVAGSLGDGTVRVWEVDPVATLPVLRGHTSYVYPVAYSPDGHWIASGGWDNTLRLWDAATGEPCATLPYPRVVPALAYGSDGRWLVSASDQASGLRIWDTAAAYVHKEFPGPPGTLASLIVHPDGKTVVATAYDEQRVHYLRVYDAMSGKEVFFCNGMALAYSPDGRWLAVRDADENTVLLLNAHTHEAAARFSGHERPIFGGAFSADSRLLATCGQDRTVRLWQIESGGCRVLRGHTDEVFAAAFHPGGTRLATAGRDRAVWLWDLARGEEVARLQGHTSYIWSLAFSPDGDALVSSSGDSTVRLWDTAPLKIRYQARRQAETLRPEAERLVGQLWRQKKKADEVVAALRADQALSEPLRHAALRAVLRKALPAEAASDNPRDRP